MSLSNSHSTPSNTSSASAGSTTTSSSDDDAVDVVTPESDTSSHRQSPTLRNYPPSDEDTIPKLIHSESHHMPFPDYLHRCQHRSIDVIARQDSINWILKLANGWPFQLLSVACLSLAAKMEEPEVPLLLDLQACEPRFVFEPKTIQKMELRVMALLNWRLRSVTPFDYLHHFVSKLPSFSSFLPDSFDSLISASSDLTLSTTRVIDFLQFAPSMVAAAAVFCAAGECSEIPADDAVFDESINREMVRSCHQLMEKYIVDTCPSARLKKPWVGPSFTPPSPVGVLDAAVCGSCYTDTCSDKPGSSSQVERPAKRLRSSTLDVHQP
ncbi:hypothetical protein V6N13_114953 [Hibiscus sabdariffa]|uniref:Cyclin C-terminal domain-containing protein n=1 Tax=Hibiscus sabdariffa TaxID=183260 RepID=A0ABR2U3C9_9ROSI